MISSSLSCLLYHLFLLSFCDVWLKMTGVVLGDLLWSSGCATLSTATGCHTRDALQHTKPTRETTVKPNGIYMGQPTYRQHTGKRIKLDIDMTRRPLCLSTDDMCDRSYFSWEGFT